MVRDGSVGAGGKELGVTWKVGRLSSPGKSSMSPVAMLKQAPCHGQRTCPFDSTPEKSKKRSRNVLNTYYSICDVDLNLVHCDALHEEKAGIQGKYRS